MIEGGLSLHSYMEKRFQRSSLTQFLGDRPATADRCIICVGKYTKPAAGSRSEDRLRDNQETHTGLFKAAEVRIGRREQVKRKERRILFCTLLSRDVIMFALHKVI